MCIRDRDRDFKFGGTLISQGDLFLEGEAVSYTHLICSFTPIQHPANDMTTSTVTTHFDYHSIDHNLLKLDILGHDDPTMIRMLQDLIGFDPVKDIPLDCKEVMSLFQNTSALKISPSDIGGCELGALGIPEFGTDFAMQMLIDAQPKYCLLYTSRCV